jgi:hypothetical protein
VYFALYVPYWFFFATHQLRFLASAIVVGTILLAVALDQLTSWTWRAAMIGASVLAVVLGNPNILEEPEGTLKHAVAVKIRWDALKYSLGQESETDYLRPLFGCHISAILHLDTQQLAGNVIDNWSHWHDYPLWFYERENRFRGFPARGDWPDLQRRLRRDDVRYLYIRTTMKELFMQTHDPQELAYRDDRLGAEELILRHSTPIWSEDECTIYRIRP